MTDSTLAAYADEGMCRADGTYFVALIRANEPGYYESTYTGPLDYCKAIADSINADHGLDRRRVLDIIASSMAASNLWGK